MMMLIRVALHALMMVSMAHSTKKTLAVLISGQLGRFIYQDQSGPLVDQSGCPTIVDVFIAMHAGSIAQPWTGTVSSPPYITEATPMSFKEWYTKRGARSTAVTFFSDADMERAEKDVYEMLCKDEKLKENKANTKSLIDKQHDVNWLANFRMLYLRHEVFKMSTLRSYDFYMYWREDNVFLEPLALKPLLGVLSNTLPSVVVDQWCGFDGYSDKIFVANRGSALALWDAEDDAFWSKMVEWTLYSSHRLREKNIFSTEAFLGHVMETSSTIVKRDLHRTEMRYEGKKLCVPALYWQCTPALPNQTALTICNQRPSNWNQMTVAQKARWNRDHRKGVLQPQVASASRGDVSSTGDPATGTTDKVERKNRNSMRPSDARQNPLNSDISATSLPSMTLNVTQRLLAVFSEVQRYGKHGRWPRGYAPIGKDKKACLATLRHTSKYSFLSDIAESESLRQKVCETATRWDTSPALKKNSHVPPNCGNGVLFAIAAHVGNADNAAILGLALTTILLFHPSATVVVVDNHSERPDLIESAVETSIQAAVGQVESCQPGRVKIIRASGASSTHELGSLRDAVAYARAEKVRPWLLAFVTHSTGLRVGLPLEELRQRSRREECKAFALDVPWARFEREANYRDSRYGWPPGLQENLAIPQSFTSSDANSAWLGATHGVVAWTWDAVENLEAAGVLSEPAVSACATVKCCCWEHLAGLAFDWMSPGMAPARAPASTNGGGREAASLEPRTDYRGSLRDLRCVVPVIWKLHGAATADKRLARVQARMGARHKSAAGN
mmetsp:Transcript_20898/g.47134  ORF Transcript_20898/g.47134 Transcript_20898/m.47134 type:complete len:787 (+) Transcript_20898:89-2449(+)|eukprot:CAMPEP_0172605068 /NCGR_PEP_ID=MMETSP1068-20121228/25305_1 /TAXON_ID=35684 /ORGANISM="Pseudopedinella elastica, Strain CCMP716" /LENGTH=786 /DNA_ID=CAMNT_0013407341 /DNA_START=87 /DNA_END=2447 /DNA_ORIENTATION=+